MIRQLSALPKRLFDSIWLGLLGIYVLAGTPLVPFHGDESTLIYMSSDYAYMFLQGDLDRVRYQETPPDPAEQYVRLINGVISKYLFGLGWHSAGYDVSDINSQWDWSQSWDDNVQFGHMPQEGILQAARLMASLLLVGSVVALFALGKFIGGRPLAYIASFYYAFHPAILLNGRRAVMESALLLFMLLTVLAALYLLQHRTWKRTVILGAVAGLAMASKHTAVFTLLPLFGLAYGWGIYRWLISKRHDGLQMLLAWTGAGILAIGVFYALNPTWWDAPLERAQMVLEMRQNLLRQQTEGAGGYANLGEKTSGFFHQIWMSELMYFEDSRWGDYPLIRQQIHTYEQSPWRGIVYGVTIIGVVGQSILALFGVWWLLSKSQRTLLVKSALLLWLATMLLSTWLLTPLEWQRYYLPAYVAISLLIAAGVVWGIEGVQTHYHKQSLETTNSA